MSRHFPVPKIGRLLAAGVTALAALGWCACAAPALGQDLCPTPYDAAAYETFPGAGAFAVALDAPIFVRLSAEAAQAVMADQVPTAITVRESDSAASTLVPGETRRLAEDTLVFVPDELLRPLMRYEVVLSSAILGGPATFSFTTGETVDREPPELSLDEDLVLFTAGPAPEGCGYVEGSYLVDATLVVNDFTYYPLDDSDDGAVEYLVFLTRAYGLTDGPRLLGRTRRAGQERNPTLRFLLSPEELTTPVCIAVQAYDGLQNQAESEPEVCFDPIDIPYFEGACSVAPPSSTASSGWALGIVAALFLSWGVRRRPGALRAASPRLGPDGGAAPAAQQTDASQASDPAGPAPWC